MQPLWNVSALFLDALEETELLHNRAEAPKAKDKRVRSKITLGATSSIVTRTSVKRVQALVPPWLPAGAYTELIEGHFAHTIHIA